MISPYHSDALFLTRRWRPLCSQRLHPPSAAPRLERGFFCLLQAGQPYAGSGSANHPPVARY
jgi:hypothetical protein